MNILRGSSGDAEGQWRYSGALILFLTTIISQPSFVKRMAQKYWSTQNNFVIVQRLPPWRKKSALYILTGSLNHTTFNLNQDSFLLILNEAQSFA